MYLEIVIQNWIFGGLQAREINVRPFLNNVVLRDREINFQD